MGWSQNQISLYPCFCDRWEFDTVLVANTSHYQVSLSLSSFPEKFKHLRQRNSCKYANTTLTLTDYTVYLSILNFKKGLGRV